MIEYPNANREDIRQDYEQSPLRGVAFAFLFSIPLWVGVLVAVFA